MNAVISNSPKRYFHVSLQIKVHSKISTRFQKRAKDQSGLFKPKDSATYRNLTASVPPYFPWKNVPCSNCRKMPLTYGQP